MLFPRNSHIIMLDGLLREIQGRVLMLIIIVYLKSLYKCITLLTSLHLISLHVDCTNVHYESCYGFSAAYTIDNIASVEGLEASVINVLSVLCCK